jgi:DNA replication initiation complex subunit (GINS family)
MNLKTDYQNLYQHWLKEFEKSELTPLTQENFDYYKKTLDYITKFELDGKQEVEIQLLDSYKHGFQFLFNDFLKIREVKLLNAALNLQEIDYNNVVEAEKLFFQNLVSAIKGFTKLKTLTLYDEKEPIDIDRVFEDNGETVDHIPEEIPETKEVITPVVEKLKEKPKKEQPKQVYHYKYILIRFRNPSPPLVGIDGINYGPFQENDIASMPHKNAKILIYEKLAEEIDIS